MIQVLIVDDHAVVRQGIRFLLEQQPDIVVVGEGCNGTQAIRIGFCFSLLKTFLGVIINGIIGY